MKKLIALLLVLAMALSLVACGGEKAPETQAPADQGGEAPAVSGEKVTVTMIAALLARYSPNVFFISTLWNATNLLGIVTSYSVKHT